MIRASVPGACQQASDEAKRERNGEYSPTAFQGKMSGSEDAGAHLRISEDKRIFWPGGLAEPCSRLRKKAGIV